MKLMNCTPHPMMFEDFITKELIEIPMSNTIIRTRCNSTFDRIIELPSRRHISINKSNGIKILNLPDENPDVMLILSAITAADVKLLYPERNDIYSPDDQQRSPDGKIRYCKSLMHW